MAAYRVSEWSDLFVAAALTAMLSRLPDSQESPSGKEPGPWVLGGRRVARFVGTILLLIGAVSVLLTAGGGLYWIVARIVFAIVGAVATAWVLLVEIIR